MIAHFFDIDVLIKINSKPWIVDKNNPNIPILKLNISDFNLLKNGVYKSQNNKIEFNGVTYWLPNKLNDKLKVIAKNKKIGMNDFAISMQEFLNKEIVDLTECTFCLDVIDNLKNKLDDVYLICSSNTELSHKDILNKLIYELKEKGISVKKIYYINETIYNYKNDNVILKKSTTCLQHLIGYKIVKDIFVDSEIEKCDTLYFYDNNFDTLKMCDEINLYFKIILNKTEIGLKEVIKDDFNDNKTFVANKITDNNFNKLISNECKLSLKHVITKFENFNY